MKIRRIVILLLATMLSSSIYANDIAEWPDAVTTTQDAKAKKSPLFDTKKQAVKKGWTIVPSPSLGYDSDTGFQIGAMCDFSDYGDGTIYPSYKHRAFINCSWTTRNQIKLHFFGDTKHLIPNVRLTSVVTYILSLMYPFKGFNGVAPYFDHLESGRQQKHRLAMYDVQRDMLRAIFDFQGNIYTNKFRWAAGISYWWFRDQDLTLKKRGRLAYDSVVANDYLTSPEMDVHSPSLWRLYQRAGLINPNEIDGGHHIELKAGLVFDSREHEADPTRGIWAELYAYGSPDILNGRGKNGYHYLKLAARFRQYVPLMDDKIVFAYHLAYQGKLAGHAPYYTLQNINAIFLNQLISDGLGSITTIRGVPYNSVIGDGYAWANFEMRFKIVSFRFIKQNFYLATNPFFDLGACVQPFRLKEMKSVLTNDALSPAEKNMIYTGQSEKLHMSAGIGLKLVMNRNFILSAEVAVPLNTVVYTNTDINVPVEELTTKKRYSPGVNIGLNYIF